MKFILICPALFLALTLTSRLFSLPKVFGVVKVNLSVSSHLSTSSCKNGSVNDDVVNLLHLSGRSAEQLKLVSHTEKIGSPYLPTL